MQRDILDALSGPSLSQGSETRQPFSFGDGGGQGLGRGRYLSQDFVPLLQEASPREDYQREPHMALGVLAAKPRETRKPDRG